MRERLDYEAFLKIISRYLRTKAGKEALARLGPLPPSEAKARLRLLEEAKKLKEEGLLRKGLIPRRAGGRLLIPVEDPVKASGLVGGEVCEDDFEVSDRGRTYKDFLKGALPNDVIASLPRSYDVVGDIAIIRLDEEHLPFAEAIADAIMRVEERPSGLRVTRCRG